MEKTKLTYEQQRVLNVMRHYYALHAHLPTLGYIQKKLGYNHPSSVQYHVVALREKGMLDLKHRRHTGSVREVPLIGSVATGPAILAEENVEGYVPVAEEKLRSRNAKYFFLRARGDSMDKAGIEDGDYLLVRQQETAQSRDKVIALIGDDATCKFLEYTEDGVPKLIPASTNAMHKPQVMLEDFSVLGVVEDVVSPQRRADG
ncbi:repressor LexA [Candidatus Parcubacteria bacterium]|nr:repressor LexA [Candidatus Parcubacteria bacterium]